MTTSLSFELSSVKKKDGTYSINIRITHGRKHQRVSTGVSIEKKYWNPKKHSIRESAPNSVELSKFISDKRIEVKKQIETDTFKPKYTNNILDFYKVFIKTHSLLISKSTTKVWASRYNIFEIYLTEILKTPNLQLKDITLDFGEKYYQYHLEQEHCNDHARRAVVSLGMVLKSAMKQKLIEKYPFEFLKLKGSPKKDISFLTEAELVQLHDCTILDNRLQKVLDAFLFQCYTTMAYNELLHFDPEKHLIENTNGQLMIIINRGKTGGLCRIPVIKQARAILEKYNNRPPIISNSNMNIYLKEIAKIANLKEPSKFTTHLGRRTGGSYLLNKGVDIHTVSKIMGHASVVITEKYYAHLLTENIMLAAQHLL